MNKTLARALFLLAVCAAYSALGSSTNASTATTTTLTSSVNLVVIGQPVTYTITVTAAGSVALTGRVRVTFNGNNGPDYLLRYLEQDIFDSALP